MKKVVLSSMSFMGLLLLAAGCGSQAVEHKLTAPPPATAFKVPTTNAEKIEAIKKSHMPKEQKDAAIAKVNSGQ